MGDQVDGRRRRRTHLRHAIVLVLAAGLFGWAFVYAAPTLGGLVSQAVAASTAPDPKPCAPLVSPAPTPASIMVNVYNAGDQPGLATTVAKEMKKRSFRVAAVGNDPAVAVVNGVGEIRYGTKGAAAAQVISWQLKGARLVNDRRPGGSVDLVVGAGFQTLVPVPPLPPPAPSAFVLNLYNTTFRSGLASTVAREMKQRGFRPGKASNDPLKKMLLGVGEIRYGEFGEPAARLVAKHLPAAAMVRDSRAGTSVDLVIGNAFVIGERTLALLPRAAVPPPPIPKAVPKPMVTLPGSC